MAVQLPDEIVVWEILLRLPPKALLRCRAVSTAWRRATSSHRFCVAHHARQPTLPLLKGYGSDFLDLIPFDHRIGLSAADQLQPLARLQLCVHLLDSCDGILFLRNTGRYAVCNPSTRQYALLRQTEGFTKLGFYRHLPTGEYRLLLYPDRMVEVRRRPYRHELIPAKLPPGVQDGCHVLTLGSSEPPRHIGWPNGEILVYEENMLFRGSLHWYPEQDLDSGERGVITVFDTAAESFRQIRAPLLPPDNDDELFQIDGMLAMASSNDADTIIGIWVLQDYESEVWTFKCQVRLPVEEIRAQFHGPNKISLASVTASDDDTFVLARFGKRLLQFDLDGNLVATFYRKGLHHDSLRIKQSLVLHTFFLALEGYDVNDFPFMSTTD